MNTVSILQKVRSAIHVLLSQFWSHDDVIKWKHFPRYWPFVRGIHRSPVNSPHKRPVTRSFDIYFDLRLNKRLSKQSRCWWLETPSRSLWRHRNVYVKSCYNWSSHNETWSHFRSILVISIIPNYCDAKWASWRLRSQITTHLFVQQLVGANDEENLKAPHYSLFGNPPVTGGFPSRTTSYAESISKSWSHHGII